MRYAIFFLAAALMFVSGCSKDKTTLAEQYYGEYDIVCTGTVGGDQINMNAYAWISPASDDLEEEKRSHKEPMKNCSRE